jgi:hypothetical protein
MRWVKELFGRKFGVEYSRVDDGDTPYLDRYILYFGGGTLRLHKFWRGDDPAAPHDHPWWFITIPFVSYVETVEEPEGYDLFCGVVWPAYRHERLVRAFRIHRRPARYRHIVRGRADGSMKPFWTLVITGNRSNGWGFWPTPGRFVPWREWHATTEWYRRSR